MIPIGDEANGRTTTPVVNYGLIALCVAVFAYELTLPADRLEAFLLAWGAVPERIRQGQALWTLATSQFLHAGWLHLIGNMLFLWVFGDNIEDAMGHVRYLVFYLLCGVVAALTQVWLLPADSVAMVGASGAIAGVLGAYIVLFPQGRVRALVFFGIIFVTLIPAWVMLGFWFLMQLASGLGILAQGGAPGTGGVAFWAHVGGFVAGALLVWPFRDSDAVERQRLARMGNTTWGRVPWRTT